MTTPRISFHARDRCVEMGISTKVAKRIVRDPSMEWPDPQGNPDRRFLWSRHEPAYAVVLDLTNDPPMVATVLPYTRDWFTRDGAT